jgi:hypothetical protein
MEFGAVLEMGRSGKYLLFYSDKIALQELSADVEFLSSVL